MTVREQLFVHSNGSPVEIAAFAAGLIGGRTEIRDQRPWLFVDTARLVQGADGEFGGPVTAHFSDAPFRPDGEFEAPDAYQVELRLWQTGGCRIDPATGADVEELAATAIFRALAASEALPVIHVHDDDTLLQAALPGVGTVVFPTGTSIYDGDEDRWACVVVRSAGGD
ncbi:hypothetical protein GCM10020358_73220 [Amorphoplanes nipponensis]|uniref:Uncharacterized protein n=1 Tax=Actinoplanes nipponensis TaxID=135950 RepID=A0A919JEW7_9ACTN|nr:hypothetical protein [Actinoplanes nipponensis]GIE49739.1 hypothetical protein Ani05nite_32730 [Actinoplanes nipponensis]